MATPLPGLAGVCAACLAQSLSENDVPFAEAWLPGPQTPLPRRLGDYELLREVARGGMGVVYLGRQISLDRRVAVKLLLPGFVSSPARLARFRAEATLAARLQHPNIVAIHEIGEDDGVPYFSMEYVEGTDLGRVVRDQPVPAQQAARLVCSVARAIQYAHDRGVLHRDLKPSNVLVTPEGEPRVTDFGLAKPLDPDCELTLSGEILGSPSFMAPEQAAGRRAEVDVRSDVYGLGGLLYHAVTGRAPFVADSVSETLRRVIEGGPVPPEVLQPGVPTELGVIAMCCLARDPRHRYATAGEVANELDRFQRGIPIKARAPFPVERLWRWARREPTLAGLLATAALLGFVLLGGTLLFASQGELARQHDAQRRAAAEMHRYVADVGLASRDLGEGNTRRAIQLLDGLRPAPGEADPRGFEWHWLRSRTAASANEVWWQGHEPIGTLAWSADGRRLALVSERTVRIIATGGRRSLATHSLGGPVSPRAGAFSHDGRYLYLADARGLRRMELTVGRTDSLLAEPLDGVDVSPDGRWIAVRTAAGNGRRESQDVLVLDPDDGETRHVLEGAGGPGLAWTGADVLHGVASDGRIWLWDAMAGKRDGGAATGGAPVAAAFTRDGSQCATLWPDGFLRLRDSATGRVLSTRRGRPQHEGHLAFSPDAKSLALVGGADERVLVLSTADGSTTHRWTAHTDLVTAVAFRRDGLSLVTAGHDGTVRAWDLAEDPVEHGWEHACGPLPEGSSQFSADGRWVAALRRNDAGEETALWSVPDPEARPIAVPGRPMGFSPDGKFLLQWESGGNVRLWDITNGTETVSFRLNPRPTRTPDQLSPDGRFFACLGWDQKLRIYHAASTEELPAPVARIRRMVVSPDSEWIGYVTGETVGLFRVAANEQHELACHGVTDLAFSPDGRFLAVGQGVGHIQICDVDRRRMIGELSGHKAAITALQFSPDGRTLVSAGEDAVVRWWHVAAWRELVQMTQATAAGVLRHAPDGRTLLVGLASEYRILSTGQPAVAIPPSNPSGFWSDPVNLGWRLARRGGVTRQ